MVKDQITFTDFDKLDFRVGKVTKAEPVAGSTRLIRMEVSLGSDYGIQSIFAGIASWYTPEEIQKMRDKEKGENGSFLRSLNDMWIENGGHWVEEAHLPKNRRKRNMGELPHQICSFYEICNSCHSEKYDPKTGQVAQSNPDFLKNGDVAKVRIKPIGNLVLELPTQSRF